MSATASKHKAAYEVAMRNHEDDSDDIGFDAFEATEFSDSIDGCWVRCWAWVPKEDLEDGEVAD